MCAVALVTAFQLRREPPEPGPDPIPLDDPGPLVDEWLPPIGVLDPRVCSDEPPRMLSGPLPYAEPPPDVDGEPMLLVVSRT